ncbi:alanine--tRNA ligase/alanyl-tRNA synthetase [Pyrobaculum oguniense TE7]|uniref:Alanine--tRNA ligase n=1 Tax=Pyrobaculum oguniense (strain DSM 13380 / JCM 10595 / TE7) TaxID=698757 RepID=H6QDH2_PYROT|nr:alanine--tRNA ligase/alanyl-tRNA synthetase [Pyrobaculum oguniense TE7]
MLSAKILERSGYLRKQCPLCKSYFWTLRHDQVYCGDQPCVPYGFIGSPPVKVAVDSLTELRERFLRFFERRSHARIKRYPVVARWRDDVYLVGASIYDFQPWVTSGAVPPPANPLVISQPSIRLTDVDKVGRSGRHLTGFEMMAHHAFNYPDKYVYWIDETTEYAYEFFTKELGIPPEEITFKESMWEGGGNAGECYEVLVRGLEVATLVFMHYETKEGKYVELPLKIVDTGYGLERIYWLLKGTPTIYDAVFGPFLDRARQKLGVPEPPAEVMGKASIYFGQMDPEVIGLEKAYDLIAEKIGVDGKWLREVFRPQEALYVLADHSRTVSWMIADGVIPSNSGAGYLARLLIRRILKNLKLAGIEAPLVELIDMHLKELKADYPEVWAARDLILELVDLEERKYKEMLKSAPTVVKKALDEARRKGAASLSPDDLVALYDSFGLPPEIVADVAKTQGVEVKVPDDFYSRLAARHAKKEKQPESTLVEMAKVIDLPRTRELFYEDPYMRSFKAKVLRVVDGKYVVLDQTAFYAEGGGQPGDVGVLKYSGGAAKVVDVQRVGHVIVHVVEGQPPPEGAEVVGEIDWERRYALMKMHTGTHVLIQSIRRVLGPHIWQAGAQKDIPSSRLDVTHYKLPTPEEVAEIERLANSTVQANLPVYVKIMPRNEAEAKYGFILYQGGVVPAREIRVVQIGPDSDPYDVQACGGTHLKSTGEIGIIKIQKVERIADGVVRFIFTTGLHALSYIQELERQLGQAAQVSGGSRDNVVEAVKRLASRAEEAERKWRRYAELYAKQLAQSLKAEQVGRYKLAVVELDDEDLAKKVAEETTGKDKDLVLVVLGGNKLSIFTGGVDVAPIVKSLREVGFRGGGSRTFAQGVYSGDVKTLIDALRKALS